MAMTLTRDSLAALPKIDLHRHLEGSLRLSTIQQIAREFPLGLPADADDLRPLVQVARSDPFNFANFLSKFTTLRSLYQSPEIIRRVAAEAVADAADDGLRYLELRFTPVALARARGYPLEDVIEWVVETVGQAALDNGIAVRLIASVNRHESLAEAEQVLRLAVDGRDRGIVGLDLAGDEYNYPPGPFAGLFREARQSGLGITVHGGEWSGAESVREAIEQLDADRIGHGVRVVEDPAVVRLARERSLAFEVCLTSNVQSGVVERLEDHPVRRMLGLGLETTLNTDDPGVSDITLTDEYALAASQLNLRLDDIKRTIITSAENAFLPAPERATLVEQFRLWLDLPA